MLLIPPPQKKKKKYNNNNYNNNNFHKQRNYIDGGSWEHSSKMVDQGDGTLDWCADLWPNEINQGWPSTNQHLTNLTMH